MNTDNQVVKTTPHQPVANPFAKIESQHINAGTVAIEQSRAIAEAQAKLIIAKNFPRNQSTAFEKVMLSCKRLGLAEKAVYAYPRGGQTVSGPSIRLAEELARAWGNIDFGVRELSQKDGISEMEAYCWDLETNTTSSTKFTVKHERHTRAGVTKLTDPRDIYEITANQAGRRLRARIIAILPPDLVDCALAECSKTIAGNNNEPIQDRARKMLSAFSVYGVNKTQIETYLGITIENILPEDIATLTGIYNSIKDNTHKPSDFFNTTASEIATITEKLKESAVEPPKEVKTKKQPKEPVTVEPYPVATEQTPPQPEELI